MDFHYVRRLGLASPDYLMKTDSYDLFHRIAHAEKLLDGILEGKKPYTRENSWLYTQTARMFSGHFIAEEPKSFVTLPGEGAWEQALKGDTRYHPVPGTLVEEHENLDLFLHEAGIKNFRALGLTTESFDKRKTSAGAFVLTPGDFRAARQFLQTLSAKLSGDTLLEKTPLILQNGDDSFWSPMVRYLKLDRYRQFLEEKGVFITKDVQETVNVLDSALGDKKNIIPAKTENPLTIPPGSVILISTRNNKKIHELQAIFDCMDAAVRVLPFNTILRKPPEAQETSKTYTGNNIEKIDVAAKCVDQMGIEHVRAILTQRGLDPKKTFICADDRGLAMFEDFFSDPVFDDCRDFLNPYKKMPGAELAHVLKAMGISDMYGRIETAARNIEEKRHRIGDHRPVDRTVIDYTNYVFCPLEPDEKGERPVQGFWGQSEDTITTKQPRSSSVLYSENFLIPKDDPQGRIKAEIPDYIEKHSTMARALRAASRSLGLDKHADSLTIDFNKKSFGRNKWVIGTQYSLCSPSSDIVRLVQIFGKDARRSPFRLNKNASSRYDLSNMRTHWIKTSPENGAEGHSVRSSLNNFESFARESNAFVLMPERTRNDKTLLRNMFTFFSLVVGKQIFDSNIAGKPVVLLKPSGDQTWAPFEKLYHHLHRHGLIGDKPEHIYKVKNSSVDVQEYLKKRKDQYIPENVLATVYEEKGEILSPDKKLFRVAVYCSGTSTNATLSRQTKDFGYKLAEQEYSVKYGGGTMGLMDKLGKGYRSRRAERPNDPVLNHISAIQCSDTAQSEGICEEDDFVCIHTNIYHRMEDLMDVEAEVALFGGAGTVQEISSSLLARLSGTKSTINRPLIIVNHEIGQGEHKDRVFAPLMEILRPALCKKLNVHFVDTIEGAFDILNEARNNCAVDIRQNKASTPLPYIPRAA